MASKTPKDFKYFDKSTMKHFSIVAAGLVTAALGWNALTNPNDPLINTIKSTVVKVENALTPR